MKKLFTNIALGVALAWSGAAQAQECLYLVGNMTDWRAPAEVNAEYYQQFRLMPDGEFGGNTIYRGKFEIGNEELPMFRFYTDLNGWGNGENSWGATWDDFQTTAYTLSMMEEGVNIGWGKGNYQINDWTGGDMYITVCWPSVYVSAEGYVEPHHPCIPELSDGWTMYPISELSGVWAYRAYGSFQSYIRLPGTMVGHPDKEWLYVQPTKSMKPDSYGIAVSDFNFSDTPIGIDLSGYEGSAGRWSNIIYLDLDSRKLYLNQLTTIWVSTSDNPLPFIDYSNYKEYDQWKLDVANNYPYYVDGWTPLQIDLPAGEFSFATMYAELSENVVDNIEDEFNLETYRSSYLHKSLQAIYRENIVNNPGGTLLLSFENFGFIENMEKMYILKYDGAWSSIAMENKGGDLYEAEIQLAPYEFSPEFYIYFTDRIIAAPSYAVDLRNGLLFTEGNKEVEAGCRLSLTPSYTTLPQMHDGGRIKISFDRNSEQVSFKLLDGELTNIPMLIYDQNGEHIEGLMGSLDKDRYYTGWWANYWTETEYFTIRMLDGQNVVPDYARSTTDENGYRILPYTLSKTETAGLTRAVSKGSNVGIKLVELNTTEQYLRIYDSNSELSDVQIGNDFYAPYTFRVYPKLYDQSTLLVEDYNGEVFLDLLNIIPRLNKQSSLEDSPIVYEGSFIYSNRTGIDPTGFVLNIGQAYYPFYNCQFMNGINTKGNSFTYAPDTEDVNYGYMQNYLSGYYNPFEIYINDPIENGTPIGVKLEVYSADTVRVYVHFKNSSGIAEAGDGTSALRASGGRGQIRIDSSEAAKVVVFDLKGAAVVETEVEAGTTLIGGIAPGMYIVNGSKVLVR